MKIATVNINNINRRLRNLLDWLNASKPDVVWYALSDRDFATSD
jgi:exonuclease III